MCVLTCVWACKPACSQSPSKTACIQVHTAHPHRHWHERGGLLGLKRCLLHQQGRLQQVNRLVGLVPQHLWRTQVSFSVCVTMLCQWGASVWAVCPCSRSAPFWACTRTCSACAHTASQTTHNTLSHTLASTRVRWPYKLDPSAVTCFWMKLMAWAWLTSVAILSFKYAAI